MKSLLDKSVIESVAGRLNKLTPDLHPRWGTLSAQQLVCHLHDTLRISFGDSTPRLHKSWLNSRLGRWLVISSPIPWPKGKIKAPREFFATAPSEKFDADKSRLLETLRRFEHPEGISWGTSPMFGTLTPDEWGKLNYRHIEHHLRQFGL